MCLLKERLPAGLYIIPDLNSANLWFWSHFVGIAQSWSPYKISPWQQCAMILHKDRQWLAPKNCEICWWLFGKADWGTSPDPFLVRCTVYCTDNLGRPLTCSCTDTCKDALVCLALRAWFIDPKLVFYNMTRVPRFSQFDAFYCYWIFHRDAMTPFLTLNTISTWKVGHFSFISPIVVSHSHQQIQTSSRSHNLVDDCYVAYLWGLQA